MAMTKRAENSEVAFTVPIIGPKDYVVKGPSGWPEAFRRQKVDAQLDAFVASVASGIDVADIVEIFVVRRELAEKPEPMNWHSVLGFLARQLNMHPHDIPAECVISFWGRIVIEQLARGAN